MPRRLVLPFGIVLALVGCTAESTGTEENAPPQIQVLSPTAGGTFGGGDQITFSFEATDPQDGPLGPGARSWWVVLHHGTHTHPFVNETAGGGGLVTVPRVGHLETDIFYRFHARAVDADGLADTVTVDLTPRLVWLTFQTVPAGLQLTVDGQPRATPVQVRSVVGMDWSLGAPSPQTAGATTYQFTSWSQGGAATQTYRAPSTDVTLVATFTASGGANVPPTVSLTSPANGATVTAGTPVTLTATASDLDGSVATVEFLEGTTVLGSDASAPYSIVWNPVGTGARTLTARATDDDGASTTSTGIAVTVQAPGGGDVTPPVATLTSPTQGALNLTGSVALSATATDDIGVVEVEFQLDGETIGTDATAPYTASLAATSGHTTGAHTFRVRARDAAGNWSAWSARTVTFGGNVNLPAGFSRTTIASGFGSQYLSAAAFAPDGRLFVLELTGAVRVIKNGALLPTPFATIPVLDGGERGLLGIAFHPQFAMNGFVYFYYTTTVGGTHNRITRWTANGDVAVSGSEVVIVDLPALSAASNHNGGAMHFGPDGKLYVAVGDNANTSLPQALTSTFGKILRFNDDGTIPTDNPFYAQTTGLNRAIWARGLRNPYTFAFQPGTGRMHVNDVGQDTWEEINLGTAGANYGWPATEGPTANPAYVTPILAYGHFNSPTLYDGFSIVGGAFYNPTTNLFGTAYTGDYFFADYVQGWIYRMDSDRWDTAYAFARIGTEVTNLVLGNDGALYVLVVGARVDRITR